MDVPVLSMESRRQFSFNGHGIKRDVIVIGASAGGVAALSDLFAALPRDLPAAIGVVSHRSASPGEAPAKAAVDGVRTDGELLGKNPVHVRSVTCKDGTMRNVAWGLTPLPLPR
jgi:hypothetical protein